MARRQDDIPPGLDPILLPGERLVIAVHAHPASITEPIVTACLALAVAIWIDSNVTHGTQAVGTIVWWLFFALLVRMLWQLLDWHHSWFVATDKRLLLRYGIFTHKVAMMPLIKVTDMSYERSIPGQLLGYGRFVLESAGQDQALRDVKWVPDPDQTYRDICAEIFHITPTPGEPIDGDDADPGALEDLGDPGGPGAGPGSGLGSGGGPGSPTGYGGYPGAEPGGYVPPASPITPGGRGTGGLSRRAQHAQQDPGAARLLLARRPGPAPQGRRDRLRERRHQAAPTQRRHRTRRAEVRADRRHGHLTGPAIPRTTRCPGLVWSDHDHSRARRSV